MPVNLVMPTQPGTSAVAAVRSTNADFPVDLPMHEGPVDLVRMTTCSGYTVPGLYADRLSDHSFIFACLSEYDKHTIEYIEFSNPTSVLECHIFSIHNRHIELITPANSIEEVKLLHPELFL